MFIQFQFEKIHLKMNKINDFCVIYYRSILISTLYDLDIL